MFPLLKEPVGISPRVDLVFKALMSDPEHKSILLEFLNAVLKPKDPVVEVEILNPSPIMALVGDRVTIVDVKAVDSHGRIFQVEMQSWNHAGLRKRVLYDWAELYRGQLKAGQPHKDLRPVISIWLLDVNLFREAPRYHHRFQIVDPSDKTILVEDLEIHTLELEKWRSQRSGHTILDRWMVFFAEAETWWEVPAEFKTPAIEKAMIMLEHFKTNAAANDAYRSRQEWLRIERGTQEEMAEAQAATAQALERERQALEREHQALERERLALEREEKIRELLRQHGIKEPLPVPSVSSETLASKPPMTLQKVREEFLIKLKNEGLVLTSISQTEYKTQTGRRVIIPAGSERRDQNDRWFLGCSVQALDEDGTVLILLCVSHEGTLFDCVLPSEQVRHLKNRFSVGEKEQYKFNIVMSNKKFLLQIPGYESVPLMHSPRYQEVLSR